MVHSVMGKLEAVGCGKRSQFCQLSSR